MTTNKKTITVEILTYGTANVLTAGVREIEVDEYIHNDRVGDPVAPDCDCEDYEWHHHFDPASKLGDYYTCSACGELTQVG